MYMLQFWVDDNSTNFQKTDVAIEKSANTAFDLLGLSTLDSLIDLGKFWWNNR